MLAAQGEDSAASRKALAELCEAYWYPVYAFIRRHGHNASEAEDLTQSYFTSLLEKNHLSAVRPERGRFRSFLLATVRNFLHNERDKRAALKRGGHLTRLSLDPVEAESRYTAEANDRLAPDTLFEQRWAITVTQRALQRLHREYVEQGRAGLFEALRPHLTGVEPTESFGAIAEHLGSSEGALRVSLLRLRRHYGEALRREISETVPSREEVDDELRQLLGALGGR